MQKEQAIPTQPSRMQRASKRAVDAAFSLLAAVLALKFAGLYTPFGGFLSAHQAQVTRAFVAFLVLDVALALASAVVQGVLRGLFGDSVVWLLSRRHARRPS